MIKPLIVIFSLLLLTGCGRPAQPLEPDGRPERIISMAPNITETLYALGLGDQLVGATTYCLYPAAAQKISRIGGFGQFNYEAIVSLNPDLVILHEEYDAEKTRLSGLSIPYLETGSYFIADILQTIQNVGLACGVEQNAEELIQQLNMQMDSFQTGSTLQPRVLITFAGSADDEIHQVHAFGTACIHNELLELAGGKNVMENGLPYSILSKEAILRLNPDIIIELAPNQEPVEDPAQPWKKMSPVNAVKNHQIYQLTGDYTCIPGPRFIQTLEDFSNIIKGQP